MKRVGQLWDKICTFDNSLEAYRKARRRKRYRKEVVLFEQDREINLLEIVESLQDLSYTAGQYKVFKVFEPKERIIMALPFRDRVAQHMVCNYIEPIYEKHFYEHSYACRKDKGTHAASETLQRWLYNLQVLEGKNIYGLKCDIHSYFQSIDHEILKAENRRYFKDTKLLTILDAMIDHNGIFPKGVGIPVGNLTSQIFANVYLTVLDNYIKNILHCEYYIRYMDDFIILSESPEELREVWHKIEIFLAERLHLELNPKTTIISAKNGIDFVGYRHWSKTKKVRKRAMRAMRKLLRKFETGEVTREDFIYSFDSRVSYMEHADTFHLIKGYKDEAEQLLKEVV